jgi:DNA-binding transcriptional LysR family regulator
MDLTRLRLLVELSRLGTMGAVAEATGYRTSAVSKHLSVLEQEVGQKLLTPAGRRVRLTPAGRRLVEHGIGILAAVDAAEAELGGGAEPSGLVRIGSFATGAETVVVSALHSLAREHPLVEAHIYEHEPDETFELLLDGRVEVGLVYDYRFTPRTVPEGLEARLLWEEPFLLALPTGEPALAGLPPGEGEIDVAELSVLAEVDWITNSRGSDDDEVVHRLCALAGFVPRIAHRVDSLHLVQSLVSAGFGIGLLPRLAVRADQPGVLLRGVAGVPSTRRAFLVHRQGQGGWPPIAALEEQVLRGVERTVERVLSVPMRGGGDSGEDGG